MFSVASGDAGIAAVASGWDDSIDASSEPTTAILAKDGFTLTVHGTGNGTLILRDGDTELLRVQPRSASQQQGYAAERTITFVNPDTAERYVTFTIDELRQFEQQTNHDVSRIERHQLVLHSADANTWSINDTANIAGDNAAVLALHVTNDTLITAITTSPGQRSLAAAAPTVQLFTAELPRSLLGQ